MLNLLKRLRRQPTPPDSAVPPGVRIYAIGDVHGRVDLLRELLVMIGEDNAARAETDVQLIFLGDLIDRGPASADVVNLAMGIGSNLKSTRFLIGNHEEVFLRLLDGDVGLFNFFNKIGGHETMLSYGISEDQIQSLDDDELLRALQAQVPPEHIGFIKSFEDIVLIGDYAFVHAGVRPGVALADQQAVDLHWIREPFLTHREPLERIVIHGHSITEHIDERANRIGIDTGAYYTNRLTAIGLEGGDRWYLSTGAQG